ncbi:DUF397 domain-containing protein [Nonomuraea sp. NEAU-A123]|uniref:DUF397 domain-containing protein n=1 Tax=Nonomuraea sp. NEAU-A123 TaxID=2839649 RepID=UPI001BE4C386|nr:DUF397 domain-containing protein [Nonomuraea sp. NEAU-A123]MBT2224367.1 DUF397 domain-containing protein [Nonomuraea sp. NEAU-A123]
MYQDPGDRHPHWHHPSPVTRAEAAGGNAVNAGRADRSAQPPRAILRKSRFSNGTGGDCVEVALLDDSSGEAEYRAHVAGIKADQGPPIALRDSKEDSPRLYFTRSEFAAFRRGLLAGEFDDLV